MSAIRIDKEKGKAMSYAAAFERPFPQPHPFYGDPPATWSRIHNIPIRVRHNHKDGDD